MPAPQLVNDPNDDWISLPDRDAFHAGASSRLPFTALGNLAIVDEPPNRRWPEGLNTHQMNLQFMAELP